MNTKAKIALIIILTLVIGILLGATLNRTFMRHRIQKAFAHRNPMGMVSIMEEKIRPNPEQRKQIREILERHRIKSQEIRDRFMEEMQTEFESLEAELDPILTSEQKDRLMRQFRRPWRERERFPDRRAPMRTPPREKSQKNK